MSPFSSGKCELRTKFWQINCKKRCRKTTYTGEGYKNSNDSEKSEKNAEG
jgi:hypothetical protein